ncbi:TPA: acyltransferase, partial [Mannheimia haemolytica]
MLMIIILHLLGHGGLLYALKSDANQIFTSHYSIVWFLEISCFCAVNCYALISGYVGWNSKFSFAKLAIFWVQVLIYSLGVIFFLSFFFEITEKIWQEAITPIFSSVYWYATAHFGVILLMPILNSFIQTVEKKNGIILSVSLLFFLAIIPAYLRNNPFHLNAGYSTLWLAIMYVIG